MKTRLIGIAMEIDMPYPHHQLIFAGVQRYAREVGNWQLVLDQHPTYELKERGLDRHRYDGVIARAQPELQERLSGLGVPFVNTQYQQHQPGVAGVYQDPVRIGKIAAEHLMQRGFKRVGIMLEPAHNHEFASGQAFIQCVEQDGLTCSKMNMVGDDTNNLDFYVRFEKSVKQWLSELQYPLGLFITTAFNARMVIQFCHAMGLHVPYDVAIICQHDVKQIVEISPQITTIQDNYESVGYRAASLLDELIDGGTIPDRPVFVPPRGIMARESTDSFAVDDETVKQGLQYMSKHLGQKLSVDQIAYELAVSPRTLQMRFKKAIGRGVSQELRRMRLSAVRIKLAEPELTLDKIAIDTGFASADTLNHIFKRETGITPAAYRKSIA